MKGLEKTAKSEGRIRCTGSNPPGAVTEGGGGKRTRGEGGTRKKPKGEKKGR